MIAWDDSEIEISLFEADNTTPLDFSNALGVVFIVYQNPGNIVGKYSKVDKSADGYTTLTVGQLAQSNVGIATLYLTAAEAGKLDPEKKAYGEARISFTNVNFPGGIQTVTATRIELELVQRPILENVDTTS